MRLLAEHLGGALEEGASAVGRVRGGVQEVSVVDPNFGGLVAELLDDLLEEVIGLLL